jgi:hypothetical protein
MVLCAANTRQIIADSFDGKSSALAKRLGVPQIVISRTLGERPIRHIGDQLARDIEKAVKLPRGWLDNPHR